MNIIQNIIQAVAHVPMGGIFTVELIRPAHVYKEAKHLGIIAHTWFQCQLCAYGNRQAVKDAVAKGLRQEPELPRYVAKAERHGKVKVGEHLNGTQYLMAPLVDNRNHGKEFFQKGCAVDEATLDMALSAKDKQPSQDAKSARAKGQDIYACSKLTHLWKVNGIEVQPLSTEHVAFDGFLWTQDEIARMAVAVRMFPQARSVSEAVANVVALEDSPEVIQMEIVD
jgi:hypothetical protein